MDIKNLTDLKIAISKTVIVSFFIVFTLSGAAIFFLNEQVEARRILLNERQLDFDNKLYQSRLSEKLSIIANSEIFLDYLRSGDVTRSSLYPTFLSQVALIKNKSISGMSLSDIHGQTFFSYGKVTPNYITLKLCYLNGVLDDSLGLCANFWTLYFSKEEIINELQNINPKISFYEEGKPISFYMGGKFGSFSVQKQSQIMLNVKINDQNINFLYLFEAIIFLTLIIFAWWNRFRINLIVTSLISAPIGGMTKRLRENENQDPETIDIDELKFLAEQINKWRINSLVVQKQERDVELGRLAAQVSHDIRSPVNIITITVNSLLDVDEEKRLLIQHAADTLNDLANKVLCMTEVKIEKPSSINHALEPIAMLLDRLVSEKRAQLMTREMCVSYKIHPNAHGLFVDVDLMEFKGAISNILNNAIEAFDGDNNESKKEVEIQLSLLDGKHAQIIIEDNGCGISPELLPRILQGGVTSKKNGHGMGVGPAKKLIESRQGSFNIESKIGVGTRVIITLPLAIVASWFANQLTLFQNSKLVILDDDKSIHHIWEERFREVAVSSDKIQLIHFYNPEALIEFALNDKDEGKFFLIDYELLNSDKSGLDIIEQLNIANQSCLVTSRYECAAVRLRAQELDVKILPKNYAYYTPIKLISSNPDCVFLDDSEAMTFVWRMAGEEKGVNVVAFNDIHIFQRYIKCCKKDILIYVDSELNSDIKGEELAKTLYDSGYSNIYIATSHSAKKFENIAWIMGIVDKNPPF